MLTLQTKSLPGSVVFQGASADDTLAEHRIRLILSLDLIQEQEEVSGDINGIGLRS